MIDVERRALAAVQVNWASTPEDVWTPSPYHVDGLHPKVTEIVRSKIESAAASSGANPIGMVIQGEKGVGKTHLLNWVRQRVQAGGGYFFLMKLADTDFWRNAVQSVVDDLYRRSVTGEIQLIALLQRLAEQTEITPELRAAVCGEAPLSSRQLDQFVSALRRLDPQVGTECQDTARALVCYVADGAAHKVGRGYLSMSEEREARPWRTWGIPRRPRQPRLILQDLSRLLALTGPSVIAIDQIDTLIAQSKKGTETSRRTREDVALDRLLNQVADGLILLRDDTRRTVCLVACLPESWKLIQTRPVGTAAQRFEVLPTLENPQPAAAMEIVAKRLEPHYEAAGLKPPYRTWPLRESVFDDAPYYTIRQLLIKIYEYLQASLARGEIRELDRLDSTGRTDDTETPAGGSEFPELQKRFEQLRAEAECGPALDPATEDEWMPRLLTAGLTSLVLELGDGRSFTVEGSPGGKMPPLHARLRRTLDEKTDDEEQWGFRGIATDNANAAQARIRVARGEIDLQPGVEQRKLILLRDDPNWPRGAKMGEARDAFLKDGGVSKLISIDDLRTFSALHEMLSDPTPALIEWLRTKRPASNSEVLSTVVADINGIATDDAPVQSEREPDREREPSGPHINVGASTRTGRPFAVEVELLRKHTVVIAGTGSGKTVLVRRIVEECALQGVSAIVLDPNNDLGRLGDPWPEPPEGWTDADRHKAERYFAATNVTVWTPGRDAGNPLCFRPLPDLRAVIDDGDEFRIARDAAVASLAPRAKITGTSKRAAWSQAVLTSALTYFARHGGGQDLSEFIELLAELPDGVSQIDTAPRLAAEMANTLNAAMVTDTLLSGGGQPLDPGALLTPPQGKTAQISVISFIGLDREDQKQGFVNQLQQELFAWIKQHPAGERPLGGLLVMDEAQIFAPSRGTTLSTVSTLNLAAQARKYGLGLIFATQAPKNLHNGIPGNAATQFFGRLTAPAQIDAANQIAKARGSNVGDIAKLNAGEFYGASEGDTLKRIKVPMCLSYHPRSPLTPEEVLAKAKTGRPS